MQLCTFAHLQDILPECLHYCEAALQSNANLTPILKHLCELCLHFDPTSVANDNVISLARPSFSLDLTSICPLPLHNTRSRQRSAVQSNLLHHLELILDSGLASVRNSTTKLAELEDHHLLWAALVCFKYIRYVHCLYMENNACF